MSRAEFQRRLRALNRSERVDAIEPLTPQEAHKIRRRLVAGRPVSAVERARLAAHEAAHPSKRPIKYRVDGGHGAAGDPPTAQPALETPAVDASSAVPPPQVAPPPAELAGHVMLAHDVEAPAPAPETVADAPPPPPDPNAPPPPPPAPPGRLSSAGAAELLKSLTKGARKEIELRIERGELDESFLVGLFMFMSEPEAYATSADYIAKKYLGDKSLPYEHEITVIGTPLLARALIPRKKGDPKKKPEPKPVVDVSTVEREPDAAPESEPDDMSTLPRVLGDPPRSRRAPEPGGEPCAVADWRERETRTVDLRRV